MPALILSSSYSTESKILRKAAQVLNWETFRFEGENIPTCYEHIYGCTPSKILEVLLAATVQRRKATADDMKWDYAEHYFRACPHMKDHQKW